MKSAERTDKDRIHRALEKRARYHISYRDLADEFGIPVSTLRDHAAGTQTRQKSHEAY